MLHQPASVVAGVCSGRPQPQQVITVVVPVIAGPVRPLPEVAPFRHPVPGRTAQHPFFHQGSDVARMADDPQPLHLGVGGQECFDQTCHRLLRRAPADVVGDLHHGMHERQVAVGGAVGDRPADHDRDVGCVSGRVQQDHGGILGDVRSPRPDHEMHQPASTGQVGDDLQRQQLPGGGFRDQRQGIGVQITTDTHFPDRVKQQPGPPVRDVVGTLHVESDVAGRGDPPARSVNGCHDFQHCSRERLLVGGCFTVPVIPDRVGQRFDRGQFAHGDVQRGGHDLLRCFVDHHDLHPFGRLP